MAAAGRVVLAVITRPHGVRGAVRAKVFNPETEVLQAGAEVGLDAPDRPSRRVRLRRAQPARETWLLELEGVETVDAAEALRGAEIWVDRRELPEPREGEFYHHDLVGCTVRDAGGAVLGVVHDVIAYPSVDALVVPTARGELEVPVVDGIVTAIDLEARTVTVDATLLEGE